eukprot:8703221-Ditylum_brightwellii.AAC.1
MSHEVVELDLECSKGANDILRVGNINNEVHNQDQDILVIKFVLKKLRRGGDSVAAEMVVTGMGITGMACIPHIIN